MMNERNLRVMSAIVKFLKEESDKDPDKREGLEIAIQCLESNYERGSLERRSCEPSLNDIYKFFLRNHHLFRRNATEEERAEGEALKNEANRAMCDGRYVEALHLYTKAVEYDPSNPVFYCNRAAAKSKIGDHYAAVRDCSVAIELDQTYAKAYGRLGMAYCALNRYVHAVECYKKANELDPDNGVFKNNLNLAREKVREMCLLETQNANTDNQDDPPQESPRNTHRPFNLNSLLENPQLLNLASQVLTGPAIHSFSYTLAREIPDIFQQLRQSFNQESNDSPPDEEGPSSNQDTS